MYLTWFVLYAGLTVEKTTTHTHTHIHDTVVTVYYDCAVCRAHSGKDNNTHIYIYIHDTVVTVYTMILLLYLT